MECPTSTTGTSPTASRIVSSAQYASAILSAPSPFQPTER
jgi:hypothetical protein